MRILHIITGLRTGGAERMLERLVHPPLADIEQVVISLGARGPVGDRLTAAGVPVIALGLTPATMLLAMPKLVRLIRRQAPDVVQTWLYHADVIAGIAARLAGVRAVAWSVRTADTRRGISLSASARAMLRLGAALSRRVPGRIVYVAEAARDAHEREGYDPARGVVLHNGFILPDADAVRARAQAVRAAVGVPADALAIGTAGTFTAQKNQIGFVAACAPLLSARTDIHLLLMGAGNTADNRALAAAAAATGHADRIHLLGERGDIADCLAALDLFCLASRGEGFPNVVGEAMAVGTPVLSTDVGDAALLIGDTGTVVPVDDPAALHDALRSLTAMPGDELARLGAHARARIAAEFALDVVRERYRMLYASMTAGGAS